MLAQYSLDPITRTDVKEINLEHHIGITLDVVLDNGGLTKQYADDVEIYVNGVKHETPWAPNRLLSENDIISVFATAHGGGGLRLVATVALLVAVSVFFPPGGAIAGSTMLNSFAAAGFLMTGQMLINALLPPPVPPVPDDLTPAQQFAIAGGSNRARIGQPMSLCVGKHKMALDLAAAPYPSYEGGENWYYGIYHAGLNPDAVITNLQIGDTDITNYPDITTEFSGSDGLIDLFPGNVDTLTVNTQLTDNQQTELRTTSIDTTQIAVDYTYVMFHVNSKGKVSHTGTAFDFEYSPTGAGTWSPLVGASSTVSVEGASTTPQRKTITKQVPKGQYDVRIKRLGGNNPGTTTTDFTWNFLRSFQPETSTSIYENQRRIAIKFKATNNLNGRIDQVNALISNKTTIWNGSAWTAPIETSNPAWWFLHLARGLFNSGGTRMYGGGLPDSLLDLEGFKEWGAFCDANSLECNFVFTAQSTLADALSLIARTGRATISFHTQGKLGVVFDDDNATPIWVCNPSNMSDGTFQMNYLGGKLTDGVKINFADEALEYKDNFVQVNLNGIDDPLQLQTLRIPGITKEAQAAKEANLILAESQFHLRTINFDMDVQGQVLYRGAVIHVTSDMVTWADSGRLLTGSTQTSLTLSHGVDATGTGKYILVRFPDGEIEIVPIITGGASDTTLTLSQSLTNDPATFTAEDIIWQFDQDATPGGLFKITDLSYSNHGKTCSITAQDYDSAYYAAQNGSWQAATPNVPVYVATINNINIHEEVTEKGQTRVVLLWDVNNGIGTELEIRHRPFNSQTDISNYTNVGRLNASRYEYFTDGPEDVDFILHPVNVNGTLAQQVTFAGTVNASLGTTPDVPNVTGLEIFGQGNNQVFGGKDCKISWNRVALDTTQFGEESGNGIDEGNDDSHFKDYQITVYNPAGAELRTEYTNENNYIYSYEKNYEDTGGNPTRSFTFKIWVRGTQNQLSNQPAKLDVSNPAPSAPTGLNVGAAFNSISVDFIPPNDIDYEGIIVWYSTITGFTTSGVEKGEGNVGYKGDGTTVFIQGLSEDVDYYFVIAAYDAFGTDSLNKSSELTSRTASIAFNQKTISFTGLTLNPNDPSTNKVSWTAGKANYNDGVTTTQYSIAAGNATWSSGDLYIYYRSGDTTLSSTTSLSTAMASDKRVLATYRGGIDLTQGNGDVYLDGSKVIAGTVGASQLVAGSAVITGSAQIANLVVKDQHVDNLSGTKINVATLNGDRIIGSTITAGKMAADSITAANGAIADLAVDTLQLKGNAVTIPVSTYSSGGITINPSGWTSVASKTIVSTGAPMFVIASVAVNNSSASSAFPLLRIRCSDGTYTWGSVAGAYAEAGPTGVGKATTVSVTTTKTAGTYTIYIEMKSSLTNNTVYERSLLLLETKK